VRQQLQQLDREQVLQQVAEQMEQERIDTAARRVADDARYAEWKAERDREAAEQRKKAEWRLAELQALAALPAEPGSGMTNESKLFVDDYEAAGLLAVATAIAGSSRIKERSYGPIALGRYGKGQPWIETVIWDGTWTYTVERRSTDDEAERAEQLAAGGYDRAWDYIKRDDTIRRSPNTCKARADSTGIYVLRHYRRVRPRRFDEDWYLLKGAGLEAEMNALPELIWRDDITAFAVEQAAGRIRYLNQQDKVLAWEGDINQHYVRRDWCRWCGKPLDSEKSITRGIGSQCWSRAIKAFRGMSGSELLADLHEYAVPPGELLYTGLIERAPDELLTQLDEREQAYAAERKTSAKRWWWHP
jgi:hypothetical protein